MMDDNDVDELGPVDYVVVEFPADQANFSGEMAAELAALVKSGAVRVLDLLFLRKNPDGSVEGFESHDFGDDELGELRALETELAMLLAEEDVESIGAALEPGSVAAVLIWENVWAAPFGSAVRRSGGQLVASGRIPIQALAATLDILHFSSKARSCFTPPPGPVPLNDPGRWWAYVPGANWRHPWGPNSDNSERQDHPVTHVAYEDAKAFAAWARKALPTEAEWEYAARGGLEGSIFAWGDEHHPDGELMANSWQGDFPWRNAGAKGWRGTSPVGLFPANGHGLHDMTGNVWEWTSDYYSPNGAGSKQTKSPCCTLPRNPRIDTPEASYNVGQPGAHIPRRVIKGGSHLCAPTYCLRYRPAARQAQAIDTSTSHIGFRCILR